MARFITLHNFHAPHVPFIMNVEAIEAVDAVQDGCVIKGVSGEYYFITDDPLIVFSKILQDGLSSDIVNGIRKAEDTLSEAEHDLTSKEDDDE